MASSAPLRIGFDLRRVLRTVYEIDDFQKTYFVIDSFADLFEQTAQDFSPIYEEVLRMPACTPDRALPGERQFGAG